jgi:hypothetical protein
VCTCMTCLAIRRISWQIMQVSNLPRNSAITLLTALRLRDNSPSAQREVIME